MFQCPKRSRRGGNGQADRARPPSRSDRSRSREQPRDGLGSRAEPVALQRDDGPGLRFPVIDNADLHALPAGWDWARVPDAFFVISEEAVPQLAGHALREEILSHLAAAAVRLPPGEGQADATMMHLSYLRALVTKCVGPRPR